MKNEKVNNNSLKYGGGYDASRAFEYVNGFYLTSEPYRMGNILAHYELYKRIVELPGAVVECGVFKGSSLIQFATFRELLENENSRRIIGFDMFGPFPEDDHVASDAAFIKRWNDQFAGAFLAKEDIEESLRLKGIGNVELVQGDITKTLDAYVAQHPELRIALLHIDTDVYTPAKKALDVLFDHVVPGGLVVFDDYGTIAGETLAVDEFLAGKDYTIRKFRFSHTKPSWIVKGDHA